MVRLWKRQTFRVVRFSLICKIQVLFTSWQGGAGKLYRVCQKQTNIIFILFYFILTTPCIHKFQKFLGRNSLIEITLAKLLQTAGGGGSGCQFQY